MSSQLENIDENDRRILRALQTDATRSLEVLADMLNLSTNAVWRRIKRLEAAGVIARRVALIDPEKVGLGMTVFVGVKTSDHSEEWLEQFARASTALPEVVEIYRLAGETDYMLKLLVRDVADYDRVYRKLIDAVKMSDVSASFAMEKLKFDTAVPI
ncbi:MAG: Lrp/AsnC family transcriptional regulator [Sphingomonadaceae bacterium]|nr:Lrp/AsnC family transcriptional regulator [Sphingomonadaceae bacterium]MCP5391135.1 Lrp/AsnC family transcriptional regulator [Sphingomonadaceae bacterium]MCP5393198.1 Lrp/AsnC family transcriptional regulator [Sphingomonadaceae bacterium]